MPINKGIFLAAQILTKSVQSPTGWRPNFDVGGKMVNATIMSQDDCVDLEFGLGGSMDFAQRLCSVSW